MAPCVQIARTIGLFDQKRQREGGPAVQRTHSGHTDTQSKHKLFFLYQEILHLKEVLKKNDYHGSANDKQSFASKRRFTCSVVDRNFDILRKIKFLIFIQN